jgi:hypothetical protein
MIEHGNRIPAIQAQVNRQYASVVSFVDRLKRRKIYKSEKSFRRPSKSREHEEHKCAYEARQFRGRPHRELRN